MNLVIRFAPENYPTSITIEISEKDIDFNELEKEMQKIDAILKEYNLKRNSKELFEKYLNDAEFRNKIINQDMIKELNDKYERLSNECLRDIQEINKEVEPMETTIPAPKDPSELMQYKVALSETQKRYIILEGKCLRLEDMNQKLQSECERLEKDCKTMAESHSEIVEENESLNQEKERISKILNDVNLRRLNAISENNDLKKEKEELEKENKYWKKFIDEFYKGVENQRAHL